MRLLIAINRTDPTPVYLQITKEIQRAMVVGVLTPDDALPSVRELSAQLGLNHNTIKQAYRELEREGVVYVRPGEGTFAAKWGQGVDTRKRVVRDIAARALTEATQYQVDAQELLDEIRRQSAKVSSTRRSGVAKRTASRA